MRRIGGALRDVLDELGIEITTPDCENAVMRLLRTGMIGVGARPKVESPMEGQTTIEEQLGER